MKLTEHIKTARTPQEALLILAEAIDNIREYVAGLPTTAPADPWNEEIDWAEDEEIVEAIPDRLLDGRARIEGDDVVVPPVSPEREVQRELFALNARLDEYYGPSLSTEDFAAAYVKGGPRWLYYTNRECVMQMPMELRRELVADVLLDSPSEAAEISADILKFDESMPEGAQLEAQRARLGKP